MRRVFLAVGQVVTTAKGGEMIYHAPARYNISDALADVWVGKDVASEVDADDNPISKDDPEPEVVTEDPSTVFFDPDPSLGFDPDDDGVDEEI